nr:hypothetical protein [Tanacetum cinerariifolium]
MVTANGGINQQRVPVYNIVAVMPLFVKKTLGHNHGLQLQGYLRQLSSSHRLCSVVCGEMQDIYQDDYFIDYLKPDICIVKELPKESKGVTVIGS